MGRSRVVPLLHIARRRRVRPLLLHRRYEGTIGKFPSEMKVTSSN